MLSVSVFVLTDDRLAGEALRRILSTDSALRLVGLAERLPAGTARLDAIDVLLVDARMEGAYALATRFHEGGAHPKIVFFALSEDDVAAALALRSGARGVVRRSAPAEEFGRAIHVVAKGQVWAPRHVVVAAWLGELKRASDEKPAVLAIEPRLTARELEVLRYAAAGLGNKEVARTLDISEATVKAHLTRVFQKLGLHGRARLAAAYHAIGVPSDRTLAHQSVKRPA